jgi:hypothetical protein
LPNAHYYWWVEAVNPAGVSNGCYIYSFYTSTQLTFLDLLPYTGQAIEGDGIQLSIIGVNINNLNFYYSTDGGNNYLPWANNEPFTNGYVWVPIPNSGMITFRVEDADNPLIWDTIQVYVDPIYLTINSPTMGQEILTNNNFNVVWASSLGINQLNENEVQIMIKKLPNGPWIPFFSYYSGSASTINDIDYFSSYVSGNLTSGEYLIKIFPFYGNGDEMANPFSIKDVIISTPNGYEQLTSGTVFPITASSNIDDIYTLQFSSDGGTNWQVITNSFIINNSISSSTSYNWTVPNIGSNNCFIRLVKPSAPGIVYDQSDNPFTIQCNLTASITAVGPTSFCQGSNVQL